MSASSRDPRHDPQHGDVIQTDGGTYTYRVTGRGVAESVRFVRTRRGSSLMGQKSIACWRRLARKATVLRTA